MFGLSTHLYGAYRSVIVEKLITPRVARKWTSLQIIKAVAQHTTKFIEMDGNSAAFSQSYIHGRRKEDGQLVNPCEGERPFFVPPAISFLRLAIPNGLWTTLGCTIHRNWLAFDGRRERERRKSEISLRSLRKIFWEGKTNDACAKRARISSCSRDILFLNNHGVHFTFYGKDPLWFFLWDCCARGIKAAFCKFISPIPVESYSRFDENRGALVSEERDLITAKRER